MNIRKTTFVKKTFRNQAIQQQYDLPDTSEVIFEANVDLNLPTDWKIGAIVGNSGTGKTTIAKTMFPDAYITNFEYNAESVVDNMPAEQSLKTISKTLNSVGFSSPKSWLKPYHVLSGGEKMRVDLARALLSSNQLIVFDEFTSVVNRDVAQVMSRVAAKNITKSDKQFIAVTCHYDVLDYLECDWIFDTNTMTLHTAKKKDQKQILQFANATNSYGATLAIITI